MAFLTRRSGRSSRHQQKPTRARTHEPRVNRLENESPCKSRRTPDPSLRSYRHQQRSHYEALQPGCQGKRYGNPNGQSLTTADQSAPAIPLLPLLSSQPRRCESSSTPQSSRTSHWTTRTPMNDRRDDIHDRRKAGQQGPARAGPVVKGKPETSSPDGMSQRHCTPVHIDLFGVKAHKLHTGTTAVASSRVVKATTSSSALFVSAFHTILRIRAIAKRP